MSDKGNEDYEPREPDFAQRLGNYGAVILLALPIFLIYLASAVAVVVRVLQWTGVL